MYSTEGLFDLGNQQRRDPVDPKGLLEEFIQQVGPTPTAVAQGIPVGEDPNLPMDQEQFRDWVNRSRDIREGRMNRVLAPYGGNILEAIRQSRGVRGI
jgi:hypothetical protein